MLRALSQVNLRNHAVTNKTIRVIQYFSAVVAQALHRGMAGAPWPDKKKRSDIAAHLAGRATLDPSKPGYQPLHVYSGPHATDLPQAVQDSLRGELQAFQLTNGWLFTPGQHAWHDHLKLQYSLLRFVEDVKAEIPDDALPDDFCALKLWSPVPERGFMPLHIRITPDNLYNFLNGSVYTSLREQAGLAAAAPGGEGGGKGGSKGGKGGSKGGKGEGGGESEAELLYKKLKKQFKAFTKEDVTGPPSKERKEPVGSTYAGLLMAEIGMGVPHMAQA
jgi:hypothetical protein